MKKASKKKSFWLKYKDKYRLTVLNDTTFEEVFWMRLSRLNLISILTIGIIIFSIIIFSLIAYTPIREFIPGYPDGKTSMMIKNNALKVDSFRQSLKLKQQYINNIKTLLEGKESPEFYTKTPKDTENINARISLKVLPNDSLFRLKIEEKEDLEDLDINSSYNAKQSGTINFYPPLKGIVTNVYNPKTQHYGIDIAANTKQNVFSVLAGTIVFVSWTTKTGFVVQIQHTNNFVSIYKHLESVNVRQGDKISIAQIIGEVGNAGTLSTGPHLHFELWHNANSLNPANYINFNNL